MIICFCRQFENSSKHLAMFLFVNSELRPFLITNYTGLYGFVNANIFKMCLISILFIPQATNSKQRVETVRNLNFMLKSV